MTDENKSTVQQELEKQGMKRTPRTWIDDAMDALETMLESRLSRDPKHPFSNSEFRNWVVMQNEILDSLKKLNEFASFMGHRYVANEMKRLKLEHAAKAQTAELNKGSENGPHLDHSRAPKSVTSLKSST